MRNRSGNHLLCSIFVTLMVGLLIPTRASADDLVVFIEFAGESGVVVREIPPSGLWEFKLSGEFDFTFFANVFGVLPPKLSVSGVSNPSFCYNLLFTNPLSTTEQLIVLFNVPILAVTGTSDVSASLDVDLMDTDGNTLASITTLTPTDFLQETSVNVFGASQTSLGVDVGMTLNAAGMQQFTAGVPTPLNGPVNATGWNNMVVLVAFFVSGNDTVQLQGMVNMDTGSGAPVCSIPALPTDPGGPTTPTPVPTLPQWGMILLTLSLLTMATWQLAGRPVVVGGGTAGVGPVLPDAHHGLTSLLVGQGIATLGLVLYALLIGPLVPHDGVGALLAGLLIGVMVECYRRSWGR